jgi:hypothetical protein
MSDKTKRLRDRIDDVRPGKPGEGVGMDGHIERKYTLAPEEVAQAVWSFLKNKGVVVPEEASDFLVMPSAHPSGLEVTWSENEIHSF